MDFGGIYLMSSRTSVNKNTNQKQKNTKSSAPYIIIASLCIIVVFVVIIFALKFGDSNKSAPSNQTAESQTAKTISVVAESGAQDGTCNAKITSERKIKFSDSYKEIKKYEDKQYDTVDGDYKKSTDGYGYLTYKFDIANTASFFGMSVAPSDPNALLQYVFYNDKLLEIRIQYGSLGETSYETILSDITKKYGDATYSREYSNGNKESWWKTKSITLTAYYQNEGVSVYYRKN